MKYKYPKEFWKTRKDINKYCKIAKRIFKYLGWFLVGVVAGIIALLIWRLI